MNHTAGPVLLNLSLALLRKNEPNCLKQMSRLLKVLKISDGAVKHNQSYFEDINRSLDVKVDGFVQRSLHKFGVSAVKIKEAVLMKKYLFFCTPRI